LTLQNHKKTSEEGFTDKSGDSEISSIINIERRASKLEKKFSESMVERTNLSKRLSYTCINSNKEEKEFLKHEYGGKCQVCGKKIRTYNNKIYFVSRNVIKTCNLADEFKNVDYTGWNSLCLCPNCAAEYLYGEKDLSTFSKQVERIDIEERSNEPINIEITLQGEKKNVQYSPKHFLALKTAFDVFKKEQ
jgi:hypothetical protein